MIEQEIDVTRFNGLLGVLRFLEKNNSELAMVEKVTMGIKTFALHDSKARRVLILVQEDLRNKRYYIEEVNHGAN